MRIPVWSRVAALGTAVAAVLTLSLAAPASAGPAPAVRAAQATAVVPDVVGENVGVAINDLQAAGFGLGFQQFTDRLCQFDPFEVTRQNPSAGSVVAAGSVVTVTFAVRPKICP